MDEERVEYSFTGDVSYLRAATQEAISLLDKYENTIKGLAASNQFNVSKTAFTGFQRTVNSLIKQTNSLSSFMNKTAETTQQALTPDVGNVNKAVGDIADALEYLQSSSRLTSEDMKLVTSVLKDAQGTMSTVAAKAQALGSSFTSVAQLEDRAAQTTESASARMSSAQQAMVQNAPFIAYAQQAEASFGKVSKSAEESMQAFIKLGPMSRSVFAAEDITAKLMQVRSGIETMVTSVKSKFAQMAGVFDPVKAKIQSFKDKAASSISYVRTIADSVSAAFRRLALSTDSAESEANQSATAHRTLGSTLKSLLSSLKAEKKAIDEEDKELNEKNKTLTKSKDKHDSLLTSLKKLGSIFSTESRKTKTFGSSMLSMSNIVRRATQALVSLISVKLAQWLAQGIKSSIEFTERLNLFQVAMGDTVDEGIAFVKQMSEIYGMDPSNLYKTAGYFYQLTDAIGMTDEASSILSLSLTKASNDIASLFNVEVSEVVDDLASGMQGMSRSVRKYGMDIRATTLEQTALSLGIEDQVETMSEANRMALRFITMMQQAENAVSQVTEGVDGAEEVMGDFARTIETPANQLRIFKEQMSQLARAIGNFFVPALSSALPLINGVVMSLRTVLTSIASLAGITSDLSESLKDTGDGSTVIEDLGDAAVETTKKLQKMTAPFDELNVLSEEQSDLTGLGADTVDPRLQEAIANLSLGLEKVEMRANKVRDSILRFLGFEVDVGNIIKWDPAVLEENLINKFPQWSETIRTVFANWSDIVNGFKKVFNSLGSVVDRVKEKFESLLGLFVNDTTASKWFSRLGSSLGGTSSWLSDNADALADFIVAITGVAAAFKLLGPAVGVLGNIAQALGGMYGTASTMSALSTGLGSVAVWGAAAAAAIALLYTTSDTFAASFNSLLGSVWNNLQPMLVSIVDLFSTIWGRLLSLWDESVRPMLTQTGEALAPVLDTVGRLWSNVRVIFTDAASVLKRVWISTIEPTITALALAVGGLMEIFQTLWSSCLNPIFKLVGDGLQHVWTQYISPIVEDIMEVTNGLTELLLNLWNSVLQPLVNYLVSYLGPAVAGTFQAIWTAVEAVIGILGSLLGFITGVFSGIIEFLNGVFTGDWKRALSGLLNIFVSLGNGLIGVIESVCNFGIGAINSFLQFIIGGFKGAINGIGGLIEDIAGVLGYDVNLNVGWSVPQIPKLTIPRIPKVALASGGVVTRPTTALIGEGKYDEAVIPLGNSPQMRELVEEIANATRGRGPDEPMQVNVYIGNEQVAEYMHRAQRRDNLQRNGGT